MEIYYDPLKHVRAWSQALSVDRPPSFLLTMATTMTSPWNEELPRLMTFTCEVAIVL